MPDFSTTLALAGFALIASITPGPNNFLILASGTNFGVRRSLPHMFGISFGFGLMILLLGFGLDQLIAVVPWLLDALLIVSVAIVLWLAWKLASTRKAGSVKGPKRPMTLIEAAGFQWVNPKAWALALAAISGYAAPMGGVQWVAPVFIAMSLMSVATWLVAGDLLRQWLSAPGRLIWFNRVMAVLLVLTMLPILIG